MFPLPMILLQQGIVGMVLYILLFVALFFAVLKKYKAKDYSVSKSQMQMTLILCIMAFVIIIYDTSLLGKGGYLFFYIMSLPFIKHTREKRGASL